MRKIFMAMFVLGVMLLHGCVEQPIKEIVVEIPKDCVINQYDNGSKSTYCVTETISCEYREESGRQRCLEKIEEHGGFIK